MGSGGGVGLAVGGRINPWLSIEGNGTFAYHSERLEGGERLEIRNRSREEAYPVAHGMSARQIAILLAGSLINLVRDEEGG